MRIRACASRSNAKPAEPAKKRLSFRALCALCVLPFVVLVSACGGTNLFRQYEYEEDVYLSLDGSATVYVNSSIPALNALHGTSFDADPGSRVDREVFRTYYSSPNTHVTRVSPFRRSGRRFVSVRLDVDDIRTLGVAPPFAWSTYSFQKVDGLWIYRQTIDGAAGKDVGKVGWTGREMVAFRLHLPSKIRYHNTQREIRGNILAWEQPLADRLRGMPLTIDGKLEARMETQSILYRTLYLFGATFLVVAVCFVVLVWWIVKKGGKVK